MFSKRPRFKSKKLTQSARGQECTLRLTKVCNGNTETTVLAHIALKGRSGMGTKPNDYEACFACSDCHDAIDGRNNSDYTDNDLLRANFETMTKWREMGLVEFKS